ncbi:tetratricopeptide repeat-containing sensor histidine kinase [Labilibaculum sp.]|uniref:tetratricopeptide repeat-containing sensor histidine kinase n=1 Tax=Labilibaculum sp. TaxID=2060723 RepID=UPI002AA78904|nr:tetratricopeptide repeat-containing sensor histidine kinase [Labilibaculum sp.]MBN2598566.1 tetratricopeptide repeat-containing sensor histidine kinase [Marinifilaceae bacterium]
MRRFLFVILFILQFFFVYSSNLKRDSLKKLISAPLDSLNCDVLYQLGEDYVTDYPDSAIYYADQILKFANLSFDSVFRMKANYLKGKASYRSSNYSNSIKYIEEAIACCVKDHEKEKADCFNVLGNSLIEIDKYKLSLSAYFTSLNIRNGLKDSLLISSSLNNIGNVYFQMQEYSQALDYYNQSLVLKENANNLQGIAIMYNNIGNVYHKQNDNLKALSSYLKALDIIEFENTIDWKPILLENIGQLYLDCGDINKCMVYYHRALIESERKGDKISIASVKSSLAIAHLRNGDYNTSLSLFEESLVKAKEIGVARIELDCYYYMSELYEKKNNFEKSIQYFRMYDKIRAKISRENNSKEIAEIQARFQLEKIDTENEILKQRNTIQRLEIDKQKTIDLFLFSLGVLILSLFIYSVYISRFRKKHNKLLTEKNKIISDRNKSLTSLNATKDKFLSIVAHDLKNPFNAVLGFTDLLIDRYDELEDSMRQEYIEIVHKSALHGSLLLDTLLTWSRSQMGVMEYNPIIINASQLIEEEMEVLEEKAYAKGISLELNEIDASLVYADSDMIRTVIRNLGNNSIKFTKERGRIIFSVKVEEGKAIIGIEDNGVGIRPEDKMKLFNLDSNYSRPGTSNEKGTGLGLILCKDFVEKNGGEIGVESQEGVGSKFWFTLPLHLNEIEKKSSTLERVEEECMA